MKRKKNVFLFMLKKNLKDKKDKIKKEKISECILLKYIAYTNRARKMKKK